MNHKGTQRLQTERMVLRRIVPQDAEAVFTWMGDPEVCKYERWTPHPDSNYSEGYIRQVFDYESDHTYWWGMDLQGKLIGSICVVNINDFDQKGIMGYCLAKKYWSKGYTTEGVRAVLQFLFEQVGINRIEASHSIYNPASGRVLQKAGFLLEGNAKEYYHCRLGFQDSDLYGLTRKQYFILYEGENREEGDSRNVVLEPLNVDNWLKICDLSVSEEQKRIFPIPNVYWIGISRYEEKSELFAIKAGGMYVGLIGGGYDEDGVTGYINPLMIGQPYQGNGYARQALVQMIDYLRRNLGVSAIHINHRKENHTAACLYQSLGFQLYGESEGEYLRKLEFSTSG